MKNILIFASFFVLTQTAYCADHKTIGIEKKINQRMISAAKAVGAGYATVLLAGAGIIQAYHAIVTTVNRDENGNNLQKPSKELNTNFLDSHKKVIWACGLLYSAKKCGEYFWKNAQEAVN